MLTNNAYTNERGFLNRTCSIYSTSYPYDGNEDYSIDISDLTIP
jgi:hypothetical protein